MDEIIQAFDQTPQPINEINLATIETLLQTINASQIETQQINIYIFATIVLFLILWLVVLALKGIYQHLIQVWF